MQLCINDNSGTNHDALSLFLYLFLYLFLF